MERLFVANNNAPEHHGEHAKENSPGLPETPDTLEFVPKFNHIQEDLLYLFNIQVTSETSLHYPFVKDEMYQKVVEELKLGTPFALDYMFEEKLLTKDELRAHGIQDLKPYAKTILATYKGTRLTRAKDLFIDSGLLTEDEVNPIHYV